MKKGLIISLILLFFLAISAIGLFFAFQKKKMTIENSQTDKNNINSLIDESTQEENKDILVNFEEKMPEEVKASNETNKNQENNNTDNSKKTEEISNSGVKKDLVSWGYASAKSRKIDTIILHSSYNALSSDPYDFSELLREYKSYGVAPHYVIDRDGKIHQLVAENNIAYHAGTSKMPDGRTNVNNFSIGIEVVNKESDKINSAQYSAINSLISQIKKRYDINYVLGHSDIAPGRKTDPWNLDWDKIKK